MATGLMVLGPDAGYTLAVKHGWAGLFIQRTDKGFVEEPTPVFEKLR
jgi:thiamine biosynthesis lipoprotein ApbE